MKILTDTLKTNGKWSIKRIAGISGFYFAVLYAFVPIFKTDFIVLEFVFWGFITFAASAIGLSSWEKIKQNKKTNTDESEN